MVLHPCDLEIRVRTPRGQGEETLEYVVTGAGKYTHELVRGPFIRNPEDYQKQIFKKLENLCLGLDFDGQGQTRYQVGLDLVSLGQDLFDQVFKGRMKDIYREVAPHIQTLLVISDEPWIPWELLHGPNEDDDFFCMKFEMGRWLSGETPLLGRKNVRSMLVTGGEPPGLLPASDLEIKNLENFILGYRDLKGTTLFSATSRAVLGELEENPYDIFHFAGHGLHDANAAAESKLGLEDRPFRPHHIPPGWASRFRKIRPIIFFNACQTGRLEHSLSGLDGWAARWVQRYGSSAFIAPMWSVRDSAAQLFSHAFYQHLSVGKTLGRATYEARHLVRKQHQMSIDWAAYSLYGHPNMKVIFGGRAEGYLAPIPPSSGASVSQEPSAVSTDYFDRPSAPTVTRAYYSKKQTSRIYHKILPALGAASALGISMIIGWQKFDIYLDSKDPIASRGSVDPAAPQSSEKSVSEPIVDQGLESLTRNESTPGEIGTEDRNSLERIAEGPKEKIGQKLPAKPPPNQPQQENSVDTLSQKPIVGGRLVFAVIDDHTNQPNNELANIFEQILFQSSPEISVLHLPSKDLPLAQPLSRQLSSLSGDKAPWGAERLLLIEASQRPLQRPPSSPGIALTLSLRMLNLRARSIEHFEVVTHNGVGRSIDEALLQASERCFSSLIPKLKGESQI